MGLEPGLGVTEVSGDVGAVNGSMTLRPQTKVNGSVSNVNGSISLDQATVGGGLKTVMGDIEVGSGSRVDGGILVEKPSSSRWNRQKRNPRIVILPGAGVARIVLPPVLPPASILFWHPNPECQ